MKSIKNQYIDLKEGRISQTYFMRNMRMSLPQYITNVTSFKDTVKILKNKGILSEADIKYKDGKDMYAQFNEIDNLNGQEVLAGTAIEHSCHPDKTEDEILKIVVKNLKKNPFYYTDYELSGIAGAEPEYMGGKSANADARQMKPVAKDNLVDKAMGMKPVKGFENAKASSNKASKESNKGGDIELMSLIAKTVRGLVKMDATGEKVKKIIVKEGTELNEGPLGTQLLRKADAALKAGQTVTVQGTPIMKIVVPAGALFPADGGPSFRLNNLENPLEDILVDGNEIELDLPAPQAPYVDTRTPEEKAKEERDWANRYGPGGGYDTPMGRRTFDEAMDNLNKVPTIVKAKRNGDGIIALLLSDGTELEVSGGGLEGIYGGDSDNLDYYIGKKWDQDQDGDDYEPDMDADYEEPNYDFDMAEDKMEEGGYRGNLYNDLVDKLKERGISRDHMNQGKYINDVAKAMTAVGYSDKEIINSIINDQDFLPDLMQATKSVKIDTGDFDDRDTDDEDQYTDSSSSEYYDDDYNNMEEGMGDALSQAQQYIDSNPTLKAADISLQQNKNDVILSYNYWSPLSPEVATALDKQYDFKEDQVDGGGEDKDKIFYILTPKHTSPNVGVGLQSMEEMIRKIVREMFDGMEPMDRTGMDA
jgi:hypothetical protein